MRSERITNQIEALRHNQSNNDAQCRTGYGCVVEGAYQREEKAMNSKSLAFTLCLLSLDGETEHDTEAWLMTY